MNEIALNTTMTAQQQIARALAEVFEGKSFRYWKTGKETIFVAKDLVEAAGGVWSGGTNFKTVVGEGNYTVSPLEINGISQNVLTCTAKIAVKWLTLSRLPASEPLAEKVWDIVGRVIDGEQVNAPGIEDLKPLYLTDKAIAAEELKKEWAPLDEIYKGLGYSEGARRAEFLDVATRKEAEKNVELLSPTMKQQMLAGTQLLMDKTQEGHAALIALGGVGVKPTTLARKLSVKPSDVNKAFVKLGWAAPLGSGVFTPCQPGMKYCYTKKCSKGTHLGLEVIETWNEALVWPHLKKILISGSED